MIPLYGFLQGDTMGLLVLADESDTIGELIRKLQASARVRVKPARRVHLVHKTRVVDEQATVAQARMEALDRFDVVEVDSP
jgi:toluene-4-monooxygenase system protein B